MVGNCDRYIEKTDRVSVDTKPAASLVEVAKRNLVKQLQALNISVQVTICGQNSGVYLIQYLSSQIIFVCFYNTLVAPEL